MEHMLGLSGQMGAQEGGLFPGLQLSCGGSAFNQLRLGRTNLILNFTPQPLDF